MAVVDAVAVVVVWSELEVKSYLESGEVLFFAVDVWVLQEEQVLLSVPKD